MGRQLLVCTCASECLCVVHGHASVSASDRQLACHGHPERAGSRVSPGHAGRNACFGHSELAPMLEGSGPVRTKSRTPALRVVRGFSCL